MNRLQWNALQVGHRVLVHDEAVASLPLVPGLVTTVEAASGSNDVAIKIPSSRGPARVVHPPRLAVHPEDLDPEARCWRCDIRADEVLRPRRKPPAGSAPK